MGTHGVWIKMFFEEQKESSITTIINCLSTRWADYYGVPTKLFSHSHPLTITEPHHPFLQIPWSLSGESNEQYAKVWLVVKFWMIYPSIFWLQKGKGIITIYLNQPWLLILKVYLKILSDSDMKFKCAGESNDWAQFTSLSSCVLYSSTLDEWTKLDMW